MSHTDPPPTAATFELKITATGEVRDKDGNLLQEVATDGSADIRFRDADGNPIGTPTDRGTLLVTAAELDTITAIIAAAAEEAPDE